MSLLTRSLFLRCGVLCCLLFTSVNLSAAPQPTQKDWKQSIIDDIDFIHHAYEVTYAPGIWKQDFFKRDFSEDILRAKMRVMDMEKSSQKDTHTVLRDLIYSLKDYHVQILFTSTEWGLIFLFS